MGENLNFCSGKNVRFFSSAVFFKIVLRGTCSNVLYWPKISPNSLSSEQIVSWEQVFIVHKQVLQSSYYLCGLFPGNNGYCNK